MKNIGIKETMRILAIDPGTCESAYDMWDGKINAPIGIEPNRMILSFLKGFNIDVMAYEMVASYGMPVGRTTFETVFWIGRFVQRARELGIPCVRIYRKQKNYDSEYSVCSYFCNSNKASDSNIRQALIDRFGSPKMKKVPKVDKDGSIILKKSGKFKGEPVLVNEPISKITHALHDDLWQAFAVAVYTYDHIEQGKIKIIKDKRLRR